MSVPADSRAVGLPFNRRNVEEWSRLDSITGMMEKAKIETDRWSASNSVGAHNFAKVWIMYTKKTLKNVVTLNFFSGRRFTRTKPPRRQFATKAAQTARNFPNNGTRRKHASNPLPNSHYIILILHPMDIRKSFRRITSNYYKRTLNQHLLPKKNFISASCQPLRPKLAENKRQRRPQRLNKQPPSTIPPQKPHIKPYRILSNSFTRRSKISDFRRV